MAARGSLADADATKAALLDAAQELFAMHGIEGASLRAIQRLAGLAPGTLQYHFDSKDDLVEALLARERADIGGKITALAARLIEQPEAPDAAAIVGVIATPYIEFIRDNPVRGPHYMKVLAQVIRENRQEALPLIGKTRDLIPALVVRAYPGTTRAEAAAAMAMAARALLFLIAGLAIDVAETRRAATIVAQTQAVIRFVAGGLDATLVPSREAPA